MTRTPALLALAVLACDSQPPAPAQPAVAPAPVQPAPVQPAPVQPALVPIPAPRPEPPERALPLTPGALSEDLNIPIELLERGTLRMWAHYRIDHTINPFYLRADFDGDGLPDYLLSVDTPGISDDIALPRMVVLFARPDALTWIDDDVGLTLPARDGWYVHDRGTRVPPSFDGKPAPKLLGDAFVMMKAESSAALIYWDGKRFQSHWLRD
jgi:hypothetical protein